MVCQGSGPLHYEIKRSGKRQKDQKKTGAAGRKKRSGEAGKEEREAALVFEMAGVIR